MNLPEAPDRVYRWMREHARKKLLTRLGAQLATARRRGFKKTQLSLADLEELLK